MQNALFDAFKRDQWKATGHQNKSVSAFRQKEKQASQGNIQTALQLSDRVSFRFCLSGAFEKHF